MCSSKYKAFILLMLHAGVCWSLPQGTQYGGNGNNPRNAEYDLYVDYNEPDYYDSNPEAPKEDPPVFVESGQHFEVGEGDSVIFNCAIIKPSSQTMIIKKLTKEGNEGQLFYVGDVKIHRDRRIVLEDALLNMTMIRERDQGDYICYYEGNPVVQVIHTLDVHFAPKILFHSDDVSVSQGQMLTLKCIAEGKPEPRVVWYRSEGLLPSGKQEDEGPVLMLDGQKKSITGTYTCKAENGLGMASETVSVTDNGLGTASGTVLDNFKEVQFQDIKIEKVITQNGWDSILKLICTAHSESSTTLRWEKDGMGLEGVTESGGLKSTISLPLMSSEDFGNYSCIAENELEVTRSSIYIDDQPQKANFTSDPEGREETRYLLTWGSKSNSPVIWYLVSIRNLLNESSESTNLGMFQNAAAISEYNIYTISHELVDLIPDTAYEVTILLNNKIKWSEPSIFNFTTSGRDTSIEKSALPEMPTSVMPISGIPISIMTTPSSNPEWCEWPLKMVRSECFFFSDALEGTEDSQYQDTWRNAQQFCNDNGGNLAQPSSINTLQTYFTEDSPSTETYWIGGKRSFEDNIMWLSGETVSSDWIANSEDLDSMCLQYRASQHRLMMGSCEENYRWICEKANPFSRDFETNIFTDEEEVKAEDANQMYDNQPESTVNLQQEDMTSTSQAQQTYNQQQNQTEDQQLHILELQLQQELESQQHQQQQTIVQQQQQQQIPQQQEVIQKITSNQLDSQKQRKLQQKKKLNQSKNVFEKPERKLVDNVQTEQRIYDQDRIREQSEMETLENQEMSTTNKESEGENQEISTTNKESVGESQEVSTTNKDSVGEYEPLRYMCPPNFLRLGNSCYYFGSEMNTWHQAHFACRDRDSQLIVLETQWEDITIRHYLNKPEFARLNRWLGGIYNWSTRRWMWGPSGEVMPYLGFLTSVPPESSRWHCVFMAPSLNYRWNHELCTYRMHYICESPQSKIPDSQDIGYAQ